MYGKQVKDMSFIKKTGERLPGFAVEAVTTENISKYENVFKLLNIPKTFRQGYLITSAFQI